MIRIREITDPDLRQRILEALAERAAAPSPRFPIGLNWTTPTMSICSTT